MKPGVCAVGAAVAIATALVVMAGCGGGSSTGDAPHGQPESAATAIDRKADAVEAAATTKQQTKPQEQTSKKKRQEERKGKSEAEPQVPLGVPLNASDPRVKKVIAGLLHPDANSQGNAESGRGESQEGAHHNGALGILDQIRRAAREQLDQPTGKDHGPRQHGKGLGILEMLR